MANTKRGYMLIEPTQRRDHKVAVLLTEAEHTALNQRSAQFQRSLSDTVRTVLIRDLLSNDSQQPDNEKAAGVVSTNGFRIGC